MSVAQGIPFERYGDMPPEEFELYERAFMRSRLKSSVNKLESQLESIRNQKNKGYDPVAHIQTLLSQIKEKLNKLDYMYDIRHEVRMAREADSMLREYLFNQDEVGEKVV